MNTLNGNDTKVASILDDMLASDELDTLLTPGMTTFSDRAQFNGLGIYDSVFSLYIDAIDDYIEEYPFIRPSDTDIYREVSDFFDNIPDITLLIEGSPDILDYYIFESIERRRMSTKRLYDVIRYCTENGYTFMSSMVFIISYSVGTLTREEIESLVFGHGLTREIVLAVLNDEEVELVGNATDRGLLFPLFNCVAVVSTERTLRLAKYCHEFISCEDLLAATTDYDGDFLTKYQLLAERIVVGTCDKPLTEYETNNTLLRERIAHLIKTLDQV